MLKHGNLRAFVGDLVKKSFTKYNFSKFFQGASSKPLCSLNSSRTLKRRHTTSSSQLVNSLRDPQRVLESTTTVMQWLTSCCLRMLWSMFVELQESFLLMLVTRYWLESVVLEGNPFSDFLPSFPCRQLHLLIPPTYVMNDLKTYFQVIYNNSGLKDEAIMFLLTEADHQREILHLYQRSLFLWWLADLFVNKDKDVSSMESNQLLRVLVSLTQETTVGTTIFRCQK